ncbi:MAG: family transcriptional regulator [Deltaproteobacteria bacterium]|nr:family transcriptional regulator [Deltaproteobacteria bacterium]
MARSPKRGKRSVKSVRDARSSAEAAVAAPPKPGGSIQAALVRGLGALTTGVTERMAASGGVGLRVGKALLLSPEGARMRREAGRTLRELRKLAGLTVDELAEALEVSDRSLLEAVEKGTATLSFELILRLSALLARNDPVPFIVQMTRTYNPALWKLLEAWGIVRIPLQMERERRFVNIYRSQDVARRLSDASFDHVLRFTQAAFEMALDLAAVEEGLRDGARRAAGATPRRPPRHPRKPQNV